MGSMSYLRIGTPRRKVRPPRVTPCVEATPVTSSNVLYDPGFEHQLATYGGGPESDEIPGTSTGSPQGVPLLWADTTDTTLKKTYWAQGYRTSSYAGTERYWIVSSANPHSGTYHARIRLGATSPSGNYLSLTAYQHTVCGANFAAGGTSYELYTAAVQAGQYVTAGCWAMASVTTDAPDMTLWIEGITPTFAAGTMWASTNPSLTTGYVWYETSGFVPVGDGYIDVGLYCTSSESVETYIDVDDFVVEVS